MFDKLHGIIRVKKENQQQATQQGQQLTQPIQQGQQPIQQGQQPIQQNVLPVITPPDLEPYIADNYKFEPPKPIEYIPPEIIPKEKPQYEKPQPQQIPQYEKPQAQPQPQYNNKQQGKRFATFDARKEALKGTVFDELAKKSLEKYKINQNDIENDININVKTKPKIEIIPKEEEFVSKKNSTDNKKYLSEIEAIKKSLARLKNIEK